MTNRRSHPHNGIPLVVAAQELGVDLLSSEIDEIKLKSRIAARIDDIIDNEMIQVETKSLMAYVDEEDYDKCQSLIDKLGGNDYLEYIIEELRRYNIDKKICTDLATYTNVLRDEADFFAAQYALDTVDDNEERRSVFNQGLRSFSRGGYYVDASFDLKSDYKSGITAVDPTAYNRMVLLKQALSALHNCLQITRNQRVFVALARTSMYTLLESKENIDLRIDNIKVAQN